jgi:hypothetical protein
MKKITFLFLTIFSLHLVNAQDSVQLEKNVAGIQTGFLGIYGFEEFRLSDNISLRTELGLDMALSLSGTSTDASLVPVLTVEPRWYYNLDRRVRKGKRITRNTGNFISLNVRYHPDLFVLDLSDRRNISIPDQIAIVPTYGVRRSLGKHFSYEAGFGLGYRRVFEERIGAFTRPGYSELAVNLLLRIGFDF